MPSVMIVAGEASGDKHGGGVVRAIRELRPDCDIFGIGGENMQAAGMQLMRHATEMAFLGFAEVVKHLPFIRRVLRECEDALRERRPDVLLLIDYPGFNLKLARIAHGMGVPVVYYISPQVWAWKASRVKKMRGVVDKMLVIFPFEVEIYENENVPVEFVGHPLIEERTLEVGSRKSEFISRNTLREDVPLVGMFPGSRDQEIARMLPTFIAVAGLLKSRMDVQCAVAVAPTVDADVLERLLAGNGITVLRGQTEELQRHCDVALTKSGTTTLELAVFGTPMVVLYKTSALSYRIGKTFALINHIAMPNIIAGRTIVPEFIQSEATPERLGEEVHTLLTNAAHRETMRGELQKVKSSLGSAGAGKRVAEIVAGYFSRKSIT